VLAGLEQILEVGGVAAGDVGGALEKMADDEGSGQFVELIWAPLMPPAVWVCKKLWLVFETERQRQRERERERERKRGVSGLTQRHQ
jgi:hypothetical protein